MNEPKLLGFEIKSIAVLEMILEYLHLTEEVFDKAKSLFNDDEELVYKLGKVKLKQDSKEKLYEIIKMIKDRKDIDKFKDLFDTFGIKYELIELGNDNLIRLDQDCSKFNFDKNGNLI